MSSYPKSRHGEGGKGRGFFGSLTSKFKKEDKKSSAASTIASSVSSQYGSTPNAPEVLKSTTLPTSSTMQTATPVAYNQTTVEPMPAAPPALQSTHVPGIEHTPIAHPAHPPDHLPDPLSCAKSSISGSVDPAPQKFSDIKIAQQSKDIRELWNDAYDDLKVKEEALMKDYEDLIAMDTMSLVGSTSAVLLGSSVVSRQAQMKALLEKKLDEVEQKEWKLKFGDKKIPVKDLAAPVVGIISWAQEYVNGAVSANPYASVAWAGISLLLPSASLVEGLEVVSNCTIRSSMRETLYSRQYQSNGSDEQQRYRETLKELYTRILKFQARSITYFAKNNVFKLGLDVVKWDEWDSMCQDITEQENIFQGVYKIWKDLISQAESEALSKRHQEILNINELIVTNIAGLKKAVEDAQDNVDRKELLEWLTSVDPSSNYNTARGKIKADTGSWLTHQNEDFDKWKTRPNSFIWLNGKVGSGKSVLSSTIIKHLENCYGDDPNSAIAYYYYSFNDTEKQNFDGMLCSLIKQLCSRRPDTPTPLASLRQYKVMGHRPDEKYMEDTLTATIHGFSKVFLIIDALDECPSGNGERESLLDGLSDIHKGKHQNLHLLCTSRREADIESAFRPLLSSNSIIDVNLSLYNPAVEHDIGLYIKKMLAARAYANWPEDLKEEARGILIEKAKGMFQYVACQFEELSKHRRPNQIRQALKDLPTGLDATYSRMLSKIDPNDRKQVAGTLKWLAFSLRPLTLDELAEIFILDHEHDKPFDEGNKLFKPEDVLSYLPSLVTKVEIRINRAGSIRYNRKAVEIQLAHFSFQEYLNSKRIDEALAKDFSTTEIKSHLHIAEDCLAYHLHVSQTILATKEHYRRLVLWEYVIDNWDDHLERVPRDSWTSPVTSLATRLLTPKSPGLLNMVRISGPDNYTGRSWDKTFDQLAAPLYYTASLGAVQLSTFLLDAGHAVDEQSPGNFGCALQAAVCHGHERMVLVLLDRGAQVNVQDRQYGSVLYGAAYYGFKGIIQLLLERGAHINAKGGVYGNALQAAVIEMKSIVWSCLSLRGLR